ncbi:glutamate ABC transporter substrate-binding protein [Kineosporia sp. A_224]|uniref:glutamate ABC transporter substrate-binding protein n=1 Tax=Kineosporia sp. A_224 TaxID=1962180 RepID=UPI000B4A662A|nr:glutamate ABC transporter substrate-binding protein [Kineosporia sp. A_224]
MTTTRTTTRTARRRAAVLTALAAAGALALAACGAPSIPADTPAFTASPAAAPTALAKPTCTDATTSYDPLPATSGNAAFPGGSLQTAIRDRGRLVVGVSGDSFLLGSRDPRRPTVFNGFDIDLARAVAKALSTPGSDVKVQFRVITAAQRIPLVNAGVDGGGVDLVARNMTMNCDRWDQVGFSAVYFVAKQRFLVRTDSPSKSLPDLVAAQARVCAPAGSTSIQRMVDPQYAGIVPVQVDQHTTCLALLQQGRVDAITGDSTVLAGLNAQDPDYTKVLDDEIGEEPYGLAVDKDHPEFAQYVNAVLKQYIASGQWQASYDKYFAKALGAEQPPTPQYGREIPAS